MDGVADVVDRLSWTHDDTVRVASMPPGVAAAGQRPAASR
jgi:hypothetical protein